MGNKYTLKRFLILGMALLLAFDGHAGPRRGKKRAVEDVTVVEGAPSSKRHEVDQGALARVTSPILPASPTQGGSPLSATLSDSQKLSPYYSESIEDIRATIQERYGNPLTDTAFKHLLSIGADDDRSVTISFLNTFIPAFRDNPITWILEQSVAIPVLADKHQQKTFMDFHAITSNNSHVIVEMQVRRHIQFDERAVYYTAATYFRQLSEQQKRAGDWYRHLMPVYALQVLGYDSNQVRGILDECLEDELVERVRAHPLPEGCYMKHFVLYDKNSGQELPQCMNMLQLELPRVKEVLFPPRADFTETQWWLSVLRHAEAYTPELLDQWRSVMPKAIRKAFERLDISVWDPGEVWEYKRQVKGTETYRTDLIAAHDNGLLEGVLKGREEVALSMIAKGFALDTIAELTGLDQERISLLMEGASSSQATTDSLTCRKK